MDGESGGVSGTRISMIPSGMIGSGVICSVGSGTVLSTAIPEFICDEPAGKRAAEAWEVWLTVAEL